MKQKLTAIFFMIISLQNSNNFYAQNIFHAAGEGDIINVTQLLDNDSTMIHNQSGIGTPLHWAAVNGQYVMTKFLLDRGADINIKNRFNNTALTWAARRGHKDVVNLLITKGSEIDISDAICCGYIGLVAQEIAKGVDVNRGEITPLYWAAWFTHKDIFNLLLENGAEYNKDDKTGKNLLYPIITGDGDSKEGSEIIKILVKNGIEINPKDGDGDTPLDIALALDKDSIAHVLKNHGGITTPPPEVKIREITNSILKITFDYSNRPNIGLFKGEDGIILIDTGFPRTAKELKKTLQNLKIGKLKFIINTHAHIDHEGGNRIFMDEAKVIKLDNLELMIESNILSIMEDKIGLENINTGLYYTLTFNNEEIRIIPFPGHHSSKDVIIYIPGSKVAFLGDIVGTRYFKKYNESDEVYLNRMKEDFKKINEKHIELTDKLIKIFPNDTRLISGHGDDFTIHGMKRYIKYIATHSRNK